MYNCNVAMRPFLADLSARLGLPINYSRWTPRYLDSSPFRHEIELFGPHPGAPQPIAIPLGDQLYHRHLVHNAPSEGHRIELTLGEATYLVAVVDGRRVRLAFDLEQLFEEPGELAPRLVLEAVLGPALQLAAKNVAEYTWTDELERFGRWNVASVEGQVTTWRNHIRDNEYELDRFCSASAGIVRKNCDLRDQVAAALTLTREDRLAKAKTEFKALTKMVPRVAKSILVEPTRLVVVLQPLTLEYDDTEYDLGVMTLHISVDNVRIYSDNGHEYPHPHVSSEGIPCWGNLGSVIAKALGEREYVGLVVAIIEFLKSYNPRDAYRSIDLWDPDRDEDND